MPDAHARFTLFAQVQNMITLNVRANSTTKQYWISVSLGVQTESDGSFGSSVSPANFDLSSSLNLVVCYQYNKRSDRGP